MLLHRQETASALWQFAAMLFLGASVLGAGPARADLIVNGGFEDTASVPAGGYITYYGGQSFSGWSVGGDSVNIHDTGLSQAYEGKHSLDLSGNAAGSISQIIATVPGATYVLDFEYSANYYHPYTGDARAQIFWGGVLVDTISHAPAVNGTTMNFVHVTYTLVATSAATELKFVSLSPDGGIILDAIHLNGATAATPEPSGLLLLGVGALAVARRARRRGPRSA